MPVNPPDIEGFARAHERTMRRFADKAEALFPLVAHPTRNRLDAGDLYLDVPLGMAALATPWWRWEVVLGTLRPRSANPVRWAQHWRRVRAVKHAIRVAHAHEFNAGIKRLVRGR